jgi:CRISPR-associated endonuclease Cas1
MVEDGIGSDRYQARLPRVGHGLQRLVVIGNDGMISLAALRWLADQDVAFVMLERNGQVLTTTGPVHSSDARLRRAQGLAHETGAALVIARELISKKMAGQEQVVRDKLLDSATADVIAGFRSDVKRAESIDAVRWTEARAAAAYWSAWLDLPVCFPKSDLRRAPEHWRTYDTRKSPLSGSQRLAANPVNAILNHLYAILESEARLAAAALGLDPGLGFIHNDAPARDSVACDLMEPVRPLVDAYVLEWITREPLKREWFFEQRDGNCRLMASLAVRLSETAPMWARAVAPLAEWVARELWSRRRKPSCDTPPTRLTQSRKREAKGAPSLPPAERAPRPLAVCRACGKDIKPGGRHCAECAVSAATEHIKEAARAARDRAHAPEARAKQADTQRRQRKAHADWSPSSLPQWLTETFYVEKIRPALASVSNSTIASRLAVSRCSASQIRSGKLHPHPRHWQALAQLVGASPQLG